jgi:orotate phosphoribosyltransferase
MADSFRAGEFIRLRIDTGVLLFGEFKTKAGRLSARIFSMPGLFNDGNSLRELARFYAKAIAAADVPSTCCSAPPTRAFRWLPAPRSRWPEAGRNVPFSYNRKEAKDHGEGGSAWSARRSRAVC